MQIYTAADWFFISGRGHVATMKSQYDEAPKVGDAIQIDGHVYCVKGVERMGRYRKGCNMGLLIGRRIKSVEYWGDR